MTTKQTNFFAIIEVVSIALFLVMTSLTWRTIQSGAESSKLIPGDITAALLIGTLVPAMAILVLLGRRMALSRARKRGGTGQMHMRLVFLFSVISAVPTLLVVIFASLLFQSGVEFWFSDNSRGLLENANKLARGYYEQVQRDVGYETLAMAKDLNTFLEKDTLASKRFPEFLSYQLINRKLDESTIIQKDANGHLHVAAISNPQSTIDETHLEQKMVQRIESGEQIAITADANRIEAFAPINRDAGLFLYTARRSDLLTLSQGKRAENIVVAYQVLTQRARVLQLRFNVALFAASLALVGLAVWFALRFADQQVQPLYELVDAARRVGDGNYTLRLSTRSGADEIGLLNRAFNRMTAQIDKQTQALVDANAQIEERRAFMEAVLESITAGIISLDSTGDILLINSSAQALLLGTDSRSPVGQPLANIAPQIAAMVKGGMVDGIVQHGAEGELRTLAVKTGRDQAGFVVTIEDITRQLFDQRQAAWSDVARRIAHEIKNPLTPIQLATERLSRRYLKQITDKPELFQDLTQTIIRQVGDLRKMVDEFSSFARLPKPVFRKEDPVALVRQALFLQQVARPDIRFIFHESGDVPEIACDRHQFGQAMTNVLKNAVEAVEAHAGDENESYKGEINVNIRPIDNAIEITITDNGIGLPRDRDRLIEPYVTTREKGTGLGLAIVNKIIEEHQGQMMFSMAEGGGTRVTMTFACDPDAAPRTVDVAV